MLGVLGLPTDLIDEVRGMLGERAEELEGARPKPIGAVFGGSPQGGQLNHHADVARQHVADAVLQMAAGLRNYRQELGTHEVRVETTDNQNAADLRRIQDATTCVAAPDLSTNDQCTLPTTVPLSGAGR